MPTHEQKKNKTEFQMKGGIIQIILFFSLKYNALCQIQHIHYDNEWKEKISYTIRYLICMTNVH